ncbi:hypothetical protein [Pseudomonas kuykendallii]|uniref:Uncharacterized protein n=1 Tax=Pseudomonas kuykendallii TaxID=1007099 RepID=A0A2W5DAE7_9PSED|nr:hypothetical protein [Pseudomonas kuykendallii]PZP26704.1 MAG: hypothetical protein DI599_00665 [Pseudomonas kuykendallii]
MQNAVAIQLDMPKPVAEALLASLRAELRRAINEHWYEDRYRTVPDEVRTRRILDDFPALAGHKRTIGALQAALVAPRKAVQ